jgi:hypothetical protein
LVDIHLYDEVILMERTVLKRINVRALVEIERYKEQDIVVFVVEIPKEVDIEQFDISNKKLYFDENGELLIIEFPLMKEKD